MKLNREKRKYSIKDEYILARYYYRYGESFIEDKRYNELENKLRESKVLVEYTSRTYYDDPIPYGLLKKHNLKSIHSEEKVRNLKATKSIRKVKTIEGVLDWLASIPAGIDIIVTLKIDGIFTSNLIQNGNLVKSESKNGELDFSFIASRFFYALEDVGERNIYAECYTPINLLEKEFTTPRGMTLSYLRREKLSDAVRFAIFDMGIDNTLEGLEEAMDYGLETVPFRVVKLKDLDTEEKVLKVVENFSEIAAELAIPADGVVFKVNSNVIHDKMGHNTQYSKGDIALLLGSFGEKIYKAEVLNILAEFQEVKAGIILEITPTKVANGSTVKRVNASNIATVVKKNIKVGNTVEFKMQSNGSVSLV